MSIKKENKEARINLLVPTELRKNYKLHCLKNDVGMSERIRELIEKDLAGYVLVSKEEFWKTLDLGNIE